MLRILHLDDDLVAVSKPGGMRVHRDRSTAAGEPLLLQRLSDQLGRYLYPVHRLDRATSGVMCFAFSSPMAAALHEGLKAAGTVKAYLVLVRGETPWSFVAARPLTGAGGARRPARTAFRRLATFSRCSLLDARIDTGRRHQIRRHLAHLAHQVIGDSSYGKGRINRFFKDNWGLPRMFLHARRLTIAHPRTGARLDLQDPLAPDLAGFLWRLPDVPAGLMEKLNAES